MKLFARLKPAFVLIGAFGTITAAIDQVRGNHADSLRYVEVLPLVVAFVLLLGQLRAR